MKNPIGAIPAPDPRFGTAAKPPVGKAVARSTPQATQDNLANARLVIEQDSETGAYVYKSLDRITGEVLRQLPREEVVKLLSDARYSAGDVFKTKA
jgi:flagellar protein FlaG